MHELFHTYLETGFFSSVMILAVLLLRPLLRKAPRNIVCILWLLVAVGLLLPFRLESSLSLLPAYTPERTTVTATHPEPEVIQDATLPQVSAPISVQPEKPAVTAPLPEIPPIHLPVAAVPEESTPATTISTETLLSLIWLGGGGAILIYIAASYWMLKRRVKDAVPCDDGTWETHRIQGAFLLGYWKPRIYLPEGLRPQDRRFILAHEQTHLQRKDNWWKLLGMLCISLHWYNPLVWVSYMLLCRDIEVACDQKVIQSMELQERKAYSFALLNSGKRTSRILTYPVAFGEINLKQRIKHVLSYRKPGLWITAAGVAVVAVVAVCFMTIPKSKVSGDLPETETGVTTSGGETTVPATEDTEPVTEEPESATPTRATGEETPETETTETPPEPTESTAPTVTDPIPTESTEPPETEPIQTETTAPPETEPTVPPETEPTVPPETEPTVPPETEPTVPPETEPEQTEPEQEQTGDPAIIAQQGSSTSPYWQLTSDGTLTIYNTAGFSSYSHLEWQTYTDRITSIVIGEGVGEIPYSVFDNMANVTSVHLGSKVNVIGWDAFCNCTSLESITIPAGVTKIESHAFAGCTSLRSVTFAEGGQLTTIEDGAFKGTALTQLITPPSLRKIGVDAFADCLSLETIVLEGGVEYVTRSFSRCPNLKNVVLGASILQCVRPFEDSFAIETARIDTTSFAGFPQRTKLKSVSIGGTVHIIWHDWFEDCASLSDIDINVVITEIEGYAFKGCAALTAFTIPEGVTKIGNRAFANTGISRLVIPAAVTEIGGWVLNTKGSPEDCKTTQVVFLGDAPAFHHATFSQVNADIYYPADNATWTEEVRQNYEGNPNWIPYASFADIP